MEILLRICRALYEHSLALGYRNCRLAHPMTDRPHSIRDIHIGIQLIVMHRRTVMGAAERQSAQNFISRSRAERLA